MNIKDLIEAVRFQVSVKPQDEFMAEVAEGLETLYEKNNIQQKTIEKLQELLNGWKEEAYKLSDNYDKAKTEAVKECLEWVLSLFPEDKNFTTISRFTINQKLKEVVGEQK